MRGPVVFGSIIGGSVLPLIPESPCPEVFQYQTSTSSTVVDASVMVTGLITIPTPPIDTVLYLFIHLQLKAVLPSKYVGIVELITTNQTDARFYRVRFPLIRPLPTVRTISLNSHVICSGSSATGPVVTDIRLEHTLKPLAGAQLPSMHVHNIDPGGECGKLMVSNPLVVGGRPLQRGQWPWLAAIFLLKSLGLEFICSGTIVTRTFVVTVGHCMNNAEVGLMKPSDVVVNLGKFDLQKWEELDSVIKEVKDIYIHPNFDPNKFTADIALLRLKTSMQYNSFIQPACLWAQSDDLEAIVGHIGTVVGWGRNSRDNKLSSIPRALEIPIVSTEECIDSHSDFFLFTSPTTLCAGAKDGKGPCNGDSGGGLMLPVTEKNKTRWQLRGIVSLSLLNTTTQSCDLSQYVVFTDTAKFLPWIEFVVNF